MKVPNKILDTILQLSSFTHPNVSVPDQDRAAVQKWAQEGIAKRQALAAEGKVSSVGSKGD
jgi:hypothetical protein